MNIYYLFHLVKPLNRRHRPHHKKLPADHKGITKFLKNILQRLYVCSLLIYAYIYINATQILMQLWASCESDHQAYNIFFYRVPVYKFDLFILSLNMSNKSVISQTSKHVKEDMLLWICEYIYIYIYIFVYICIYIYVYICIYIFTNS